jgi:hypothetical protein
MAVWYGALTAGVILLDTPLILLLAAVPGSLLVRVLPTGELFGQLPRRLEPPDPRLALASGLLRQIGRPVPIGAYGSVLVNNGFVRRIFAEAVQKEFPQAEVRVPEISPEYGAARFAAHALGIRWEETK